LRRRPGDSQRQSGRSAAPAGGADGRSPRRGAAVPAAKPGGEKRGPTEDRWTRLAARIDAGLAAVAEARVAIQQQVADLRLVAEALDPQSGRLPQRRAQFTALQERFAASEVPF